MGTRYGHDSETDGEEPHKPRDAIIIDMDARLTSSSLEMT